MSHFLIYSLIKGNCKGDFRGFFQDGSEIFHAIHTEEMLEDFKPIGTLA
jgi:hypothetical protein